MRKFELFCGIIIGGVIFSSSKTPNGDNNMTENEIKSAQGDLSDGRIIELYWERDDDAIKATDEKYGKYLSVISYNIVKDRLDCEECVNDTYMTAWNKIPPARPNVLQRFLSKITRNISVDKYRRLHTQKHVPSELTASLEELDECIHGIANEAEKEKVQKIRQVLSDYLFSLTEKERFMFVCRYYYADPVASIAKMLNISDKTVYRDLKNIREGLRKELLKEGITV